MKFEKIETQDFVEWADNTHALYSSQFINNKQLRFQVNYNKKYIVTYGTKLLYEGPLLHIAIRAFNYIEKQG